MYLGQGTSRLSGLASCGLHFKVKITTSLRSVQDITKSLGKKMHNNENNVISSIKIGWAYSRDQRFV